MKNQNEDQAFEQWLQAKIDRDWDNLPQIITCRQKVGTVIPFSRTVDRDPNPHIPLSVPENSYPKISKKEALFWGVVGAILAAWWMGAW
jgi:hypothetical protein